MTASLQRLFLWTALALTLSLLGCGSSASTRAPDALPSAFPTHSADEIRTRIQTPTDTLRRFSGRARIRVRAPEQNRSFNAEIRQERADSLFMRFSLFGFEGARMLLTPDSVFFYDSRKQTLHVGPVAAAQRLFPAPVASNNVFENLLGLVVPSPQTQWTVTADSARYRLSNPSGTETWTVDPRRWRVIQYTRSAPDGTVLEVRRFSDFHSVQGVILPRVVTFRRPSDNLLARINYKKVRLNPSGLSYELGVPSGVPRTPLRSR
ncbi:MAG: DUF4292 domain-containing protein [Salinibacter sp.]